MSLTAFNRVRRMKQEQEMKPENIERSETNNKIENKEQSTNEETLRRRRK